MVAAPNTRARRPRDALPYLLAAAVGGLCLGVAFFGGAAGDGSVFWLGLAAAILVTAGALAATLGAIALPQLDRAGNLAVALMVALVAWIGVTIVWSIAGDRSWAALNKGCLYLLLLACGLLLGALGGRTARAAGAIVAAVLGLVLVWALVGVAVPSLFPDGDRIARLRNPIGHPNGLALVADAALAFGLWLTTAGTRRLVRAAGALLLYVAVLALLLTQSRSGVAAAVVVVALWLVLSRERVEGALAAVAAGAPAAIVGAWAFTRPALVEDAAGRAARVDDAPLFAVLALAGGGAAMALVVLLPLARLAAQRRRVVVRALVAGTAVAAALAFAGLAAAVDDPFSEGECANDPSRLGSLCANNRIAWWGEALDVWRAHPVGGSGGGTFEVARTRYRDNGDFVVEPHSVPLQLLSDAGVVGLALLAGFVAALAVALARAVGRLRDGERAAAVALVALPAAFAVHAFVDFPLDFPALAGVAVIACGGLLAAGRPSRRRPGALAAAALAACVLAVVGALGSPELASRGVARSLELLDEGRVSEAADVAQQAQALDPLSLEPLYARAGAASRAGDFRGAHSFYLDATALQPENPDAWYHLGLFRLDVLDDACGAWTALNHAYTLDPKSVRWSPGGPLDEARDAVNAGACG